MATKCGRCSIESHCFHDSMRSPCALKTRMLCSQRASTPILLPRLQPGLDAVLGERAGPAVAGQARHRRVAPRQAADREHDARPDLLVAAAARSPAARRAAARTRGSGSPRTRSARRRTSTPRGPAASSESFGQSAGMYAPKMSWPPFSGHGGKSRRGRRC